MRYYVGMDLHSNNTVIGIIDEDRKRIHKRKLQNDFQLIKNELQPFQKDISGIVIESTFNWYWLVDGLMESGYKVHLANPSAIVQYEGIKHTNDYTDAFHLADLLKLGILCEGYIYPKEQRQIRDLLRKRLLLVRQRVAIILSFENMYNRSTGKKIRVNEIQLLTAKQLERIFQGEYNKYAANALLRVINSLDQEINEIEKKLRHGIKLNPDFQNLLTVPGIGTILALTIALETGDINRFPSVGNYASYCRCVGSTRLSNDRKKGENNRKNGNKYLSWAFVEAAHQAKRRYDYVTKFYQRKLSQKNNIIAIKAIAHKIARACYFIMKDKVEFSPQRAFGQSNN